MENTYSDYDNAAQEEQVNKPVSPFADSPYVTAIPCETVNSPVKKSTRKKNNWVGKAALVFGLLVFTSCITAACVSVYWNQRMQTFEQAMDNKLNVLQGGMNNTQLPAGNSGVVSGQEGSLTPGQVYAQNVQAVVAVSNQGLTTNIYGQVSQTASSGSGFIISEDGYIVSNYHVVEGANKLSVITSDRKEYSAELVGYDATNDLAVLKIDATGLPFVKLGSSDALAVGDLVMAIGNPLGELTSTLTVGYVSAKDRAVNTDGTNMNMLQTDAAINSGNSGGPLFNSYGEVIGITTAKYSGTSSSGATIEGIGFAIPIDDVVGMIEDLKDHGYISGAYLGVMVRDMDTSVSQTYGLPMGVLVEEVTAGSCAEKAGVQAKDIITNIGGYDIESMSQLTRALRKLEPGEKTTITVHRGGTQVYLDITLDEKPRETQTQQPETQEPAVTPGQDFFDEWFGHFFPGFGG